MDKYRVVTRENDVGQFAADVNAAAGFVPYGAPLLVGQTFHQLLVRAQESKILLLNALVEQGSNYPSPSATTTFMVETVDEVVSGLNNF